MVARRSQARVCGHNNSCSGSSKSPNLSQPYDINEPMEASPFNGVHTQYEPVVSKTFNMGVPPQSNLDAASVNQQLKQYESYLDDYGRFRRRKLRYIAMSKYSQIMQSIKSKSRDRFQFEYHEEEEEIDEDDIHELDEYFQANNNGRFLGHSEHAQQFFSLGANTMGPRRGQRRQDCPDWNKIIRRHRSRVRSNQYASQHAFTWGTIAPNNNGQ